LTTISGDESMQLILHRYLLQGVGNRFDYFYDRPWQPHELRQTRLVFIGRDLDRAHIESLVLPESVNATGG